MNVNSVRDSWRWLGITLLAVGLSGCATWMSAPPPAVHVPPPAAAPAPVETYSYQHEVRKGKPKAAQMAEKYVVALARIADTSLVDTPFGDVVPMNEGAPVTGSVTQINVQIDSANNDKNEPEEAPLGEPMKMKRETNAWLSTASRAQLIDALLETGVFDVLERDNINDIVRELDFGQSGYVDQDASARAGALKGVQYIIKGSFDINPKAFAAKRVTPDNWLEESGELPLIMILRMYNVETGSILASGKGMGANREEAIIDAVDDLVAEL